MTTLQALIDEASSAPEPLVREALDFLRFLRRSLADEEGESLLAAAETSLSRDWASPEEDEAWKDL